MPIEYRPPYDSPLEDLFAKYATRFIDSKLNWRPQFDVSTICGSFRLDFVVEVEGSCVAFECDGAEFHNPRRDEWRDAMILGAREIDCIYRLRGADLVYHLEDCLYVASRWNPEVFGDRGCHQLRCLASNPARQSRDAHDPHGTMARIGYPPPLGEKGPGTFIWVERRYSPDPPGRESFWRFIFSFAEKIGGGPLDEVIAKFEAAYPFPRVR